MRQLDRAANPFPIRAVIDSNVFPHTRLWMKPLESLARDGYVRLFWSPWIISEVNRILTWQWIRRNGSDTSNQAWERCSEQAKAMFSHATRMFEVVDDRPPYPAIWGESSSDAWDIPIFAAARRSEASFLVTDNLADAPPIIEGLRVWEGVAYLHPTRFLDFVTWVIDESVSSDQDLIDNDAETRTSGIRSETATVLTPNLSLLQHYFSVSQPDLT